MSFKTENKKISRMVVVIPQYDFAWNFSEGLAWVKKDGKYGFIDKTGKVVIALQYDNTYDFDEGSASVLKDGEWFKINRQGQRVDWLKVSRQTTDHQGLLFLFGADVAKNFCKHLYFYNLLRIFVVKCPMIVQRFL